LPDSLPIGGWQREGGSMQFRYIGTGYENSPISLVYIEFRRLEQVVQSVYYPAQKLSAVIKKLVCFKINFRFEAG